MKVLTSHKIEEEDPPETLSCSEKTYNFLDGLIISPSNPYKMFWDSFSSIMYLISIFTVPLLLAFHMRLAGFLYSVDIAVDYVNLIDIIGNFFTQVMDKSSHQDDGKASSGIKFGAY